MKTLHRALTGIGFSLAVGAGAYAAEITFGEGDTQSLANKYAECATIADTEIRATCVETVVPSFTYLDAIQLGSVAALGASCWYAFRSIRQD